VRFRIRRHRNIHPLAFREFSLLARLDDEATWAAHRATNPPDERPALVAPPEAGMTAPPPPFPSFTNGLRSQATGGDARAERLVRAVRLELEDLKQAVDSWGESRDDMLEIDLEAVRADPAAAATIPAGALVRGLVSAADRISELEHDLASSERQLVALREELARLQEEHSYVRGRTETLHDVIAALHGNLDDLRAERERSSRLPSPEPPRALRPGHSESDPFGMGGAFR
jgi:hypothetical protein